MTAADDANTALTYWDTIEAALTALPETYPLRSEALASFDHLKERVLTNHAALKAQAEAADITDNLINDLTRTAWHWKACVEAAEREAQDARLARTVGIGTMKQRARAAEADRDAYKARYDSYEPGTMEGQVRAIWDLAEHYGHPTVSSKHPVGFLQKYIEAVEAERDRLADALREVPTEYIATVMRAYYDPDLAETRELAEAAGHVQDWLVAALARTENTP